MIKILEEKQRHHPKNLTGQQLGLLKGFAEGASGIHFSELLQRARSHVDQAALAYERDPMVNLRLARAILDSILEVSKVWDGLGESPRYWLAGAVLYFAHSNDDEPDFQSVLGFEDDAEILNACLHYANLNQLCLNAADYDEL